MPLPHFDRPLVFLDIEATGLNRTVDRIIELAMIKLNPDHSRASFVQRFNPGIPIPPVSTRIHGITDEDIQHSPPFAASVDDIAAFLDGCDLGGYNLIHFDVPMLVEEFKRADRKFGLKGRRIIDAQKIFHKREPRDLSAALAFYCGEEHGAAHGALADTEATIRVLEGQYEKYPDLPDTTEALADYCMPREGHAIDREGKLCWTDEDEVAINFGQNKGKLLKDLVQRDKPYLNWILNKDFQDDVKQIVREALAGRFPQPAQRGGEPQQPPPSNPGPARA